MTGKRNQENSQRLSYKPEVDGLRAIAVVSVILYHAQVVLLGRNWFGGGFIGVDIFFVISGYLITRIILSELQIRGSFSFLDFYERRARRILPMFFVMVYVTAFFGWFLIGPSDLIEFAKSVGSAVFFSSNFFFYFNTTEYGADSALLKPFLHTWSLGVEEQFYLVFPLVAIIIFKYFRQYFLFILIILSLLSLLFSNLMEIKNSDLNFFLPLSRFWELSVGSILAYTELNYKSSNNAISKKVFSALGLCLITYSILFFDSKTPHPSIYTMIPIIGVALVIVFASKDVLVGKILASKPFVGMGLVSYSAYLWHFPIMSLFRITNDGSEIPLMVLVLIVITTIVLSIFSYRYVEQPFRNKKFLPKKLFFSAILSIFIITTLLVVFTIKQDGFPNRYPTSLQRASFDDRFANVGLFEKCHKLEGADAVAEDEFCHIGNGAESVYLIGDSHMISIAFKLSEALKAKETSLVLMTRGGALFGRNSKIDKARLDYLKYVRNSIVVIGGFAHEENDDFFESKRTEYENFFSMLDKNNNTIIVIYPIPSTNINRRGIGIEYMLKGYLKDKKSSLKEFEVKSLSAYRFYDSLPFDFLKVYPQSYLCSNPHCFGVRDGKILISDIDHPSSLTSAWIVSRIFKKLGWKQ
ncbi:acyltransferase family protein [Methylophilaceae bacterium]|nr:acyltransferase family protein [Methylophilaceae bacterium]